jgi:hypothetical protein
MAMTRRNFLEAGIGGVGLSLAQGASHAQSPATAGLHRITIQGSPLNYAVFWAGETALPPISVSSA